MEEENDFEDNKAKHVSFLKVKFTAESIFLHNKEIQIIKYLNSKLKTKPSICISTVHIYNAGFKWTLLKNKFRNLSFFFPLSCTMCLSKAGLTNTTLNFNVMLL